MNLDKDVARGLNQNNPLVAFLFTPFALMFLFFSNSTAFCQETDDIAPLDRQLAQKYLTGLLEGRRRLTSGKLRASEHVFNSSKLKPLRPTELYIAFDYDQGLFRFERKSQKRLFVIEDHDASNSTPKLKPQGELRTEDYEAKFIRTTARDLVWSSSNPHQVNSKNPTEDRIAARPFHPTSLGLVGAGDSVPIFWTCDKLLNVFDSQRIVEVMKEAKQVLKISWVFGPEDSLKRSLWIDGSRGYVPIRMQLLERINTPVAMWSKPILEIVTDWVNQNGVWVPDHCQETRSNLKNNQQTKFDLNIDWISVNEELNAVLFTAQGLNLSKFANVVDRRLEKPIITEKLGPHSKGLNTDVDNNVDFPRNSGRSNKSVNYF